jgi:hypothetical protein
LSSGGGRPPSTAVEGHAEAIELQRLIFHGAEKDPSRADSALYLVGLMGQRPFVARLHEKQVVEARERDRVVGLGLVGSAFALVGWALRCRRKACRAKGGPEHTPERAGPHNRAVNVTGAGELVNVTERSPDNILRVGAGPAEPLSSMPEMAPHHDA